MRNQNGLNVSPLNKTLVIVTVNNTLTISHRIVSADVAMREISRSRHGHFASPLRKPHSHRERRESRSAHSRRSYRRRKDLVSELPDHLLHQILLKLRTRDSIKTSVLSRRWRHVWKRVPGLDLNYTDFRYNRLKNFVNRFLDRDKKALICQFKLKFDSEKYEIDKHYFKKWMNSVVTRGVQHLVVNAFSVDTYDSNNCWPIELPVSVWKCETLVHLKLAKVQMQNFENVYLPCLDTMHLAEVWFPSDAALEKLISSSQVLRGLKIKRVKNVKVLRVRSQTLYSLSIYVSKRFFYDSTDGVVIDAPLLNCLSLKTDQLIDLAFNSLCSPTNMDVEISSFFLTDSSWTEAFRNFLTGISKVTNLTLFSNVLEAIYTDWGHVPLPIFSNMTRLQVSFSPSISDFLLRLLARCPNLKSLVMTISSSGDRFKISRSPVPMCLLTSLEVVTIWWPIEKYPLETKLVEYFLRNAAVLRKFTQYMPVHYTTEEKYQFVSRILTFPRRSSACQVFVY